ncbi:MAG: glycosyltransferase [Bacteroidia bacterium]
MSAKRKIVITTDWYYPGFKAGGPIRSVVNLIRAIENDFDIYVYASDRDLGESESYPSVRANEWNVVSNHKVFYSNKYSLDKILKEIAPDVLYINGIYSKNYSVKPLLTAKKQKFQGKIIISPRGMLSEGALKIKTLKKKTFLTWTKTAKLYKNVLWHVTSTQEEQDLQKRVSKKVDYRFINNISILPSVKKQNNEVSDVLKLVSVSRISSIKNLDFIIEILLANEFKKAIHLDIFGNIENEHYYKQCLSLINKYPKSRNKVSFKGEFNPNELDTILLCYNLGIFPTKNENFGHAIVECLSVGLPVIISDKTPWQNLEKYRCGFVLPLKKQLWLNQLRELCEQSDNTFTDMSKNAANYFSEHIYSEEDKKKYVSLFLE